MKPLFFPAMAAAILCGVSLVGPIGCASDFVADPTRPRPTRAVQDPVESNSASAEARAGGATGVPLVTVDLPNKEGQSPKVRTISDAVNDTVNPPAAATAPPSAIPTTAPSTIHIDPIQGPHE